jgi:hypothetical protein
MTSSTVDNFQDERPDLVIRHRRQALFGLERASAMLLIARLGMILIGGNPPLRRWVRQTGAWDAVLPHAAGLLFPELPACCRMHGQKVNWCRMQPLCAP